MRGSCLQAAIGEVALKQTHQRRGLSDRSTSRQIAILAFRRPGWYWPTAHIMQIEGELSQIERLLSDAGAETTDWLQRVAVLDDAARIDSIPFRFEEMCRSRCGLFRRCRDEAIQRSDLAMIGSDARESLGPMNTVRRAVVLMRGLPAGKVSDQEQEIAEQLVDALRIYEEGTGK